MAVVNESLKDSGKRPLILFSGGLDSTYTLWSHLSQGIDVDVLYVKGVAHPEKIEKELAVRQKIMTKCHSLFEGRVRAQYEVDSPTLYGGAGTRYGQSASWINGALCSVDPDVHSEVLISFIRGDGILTDLHHIQEAWKNLSNVANNEFVPLRFPLATCNKHLIIHWWRKYKCPLLDMVWVCETPKKDKLGRLYKCNRCMPCVTWVKENAAVDHMEKYKINW